MCKNKPQVTLRGMEPRKEEKLTPLPDRLTPEQAAALNREADNLFGAIEFAEDFLRRNPEMRKHAPE